METEPLQRCDNCQKDFPESKIATHFGYCRRNIKKCPDCNEMYDINFKEEHEQEYHKQQTCAHCKKTFPADLFKAHQKSCTQKPKYCEYCDLNVPVNTYPTHLKACESRTKPCTKCNLPIMNKDYYLHIVSCQGPKEETKPTRSYQQHIQQQRKVIQQNSNVQKVNSREKITVPYYQQNKEYAPNIERKSVQQPPKVISYNPPPRQQFKVQEKREDKRQQPPQLQPKKEQIRKFTNVPQAVTITYGNSKKQDPRPIGRVPNPNPPSSNPVSYANQNFNANNYRNDYGTKGKGSVQPIKQNTRSKQQQPASYKDLYPRNEGSRGVGIKQSKSIERKSGQPVITRKEQKPNNFDYAQTTNPVRIKAPETKPRVIYQDKYPESKYEQDVHQGYSPNESYGVGLQQDPQLQMAIMQSLGQGGKTTKKSPNDFQAQMNNESFIQEQKAIQAELRNKKRR